MTPIELLILIIIFGTVFIFLEIRYCPRIDITREKDVFLWYNYHYYNYANEKWFVSRQSKFLFKLK